MELSARVLTRMPDRLRRPHRGEWADAHGMPLYRIYFPNGRVTTNCAVAADGNSLVITEPETGAILFHEVPAQ